MHPQRTVPDLSQGSLPPKVLTLLTSKDTGKLLVVLGLFAAALGELIGIDGGIGGGASGRRVRCRLSRS